MSKVVGYFTWIRAWKFFLSSSFLKPNPNTAPLSDAFNCTNFADVHAIMDSLVNFILMVSGYSKFL